MSITNSNSVKSEFNSPDNTYDNQWHKVRVAMLVRNFSQSGGLELYAYEVIKGLLEHGINITVICENANAELKHEKLKVVQIPGHSKASPSKAERILHYFQEFSSAITKHGPFDIVHSHHVGAAPVDVVTFHNHTVFRIEDCGKPAEIELNKFKLLFRSDYKLRQEMDSKLTQQATALIFPSVVCKQDFMKYYQLDKLRNIASLIVAYPGWQLPQNNLPTGKLPAVKQNSDLLSTDKKMTTMIFVGRGYRKKGLDVLLLACRILKSKNYSFKLLIAGLAGKPFDLLRLKMWGLSDCVSYLGFCQDMERVYQAGSIIVMPSRVEPFGMSTLQGMSYGLVPVVSKVSGVAELLSEDKDALIIDNHLDAEELSKKLAYLIDNPQQIDSRGEQAQTKARSVNWQSTVDKTLGSYRLVFQKKYVI